MNIAVKIDSRSKAPIVKRLVEICGDGIEIEQLNPKTFYVRREGRLVHIVKTGPDIHNHSHNFVNLSNSKVKFLRAVNRVIWKEQEYDIIDVLWKSRLADTNEVLQAGALMISEVSDNIRFLYTPPTKFGWYLVDSMFKHHGPVHYPNKDLDRIKAELYGEVERFQNHSDESMTQGFFHGDFRCGNVIVNIDAPDRSFYVVDFDGCCISYKIMDMISAFCQGYMDPMLFGKGNTLVTAQAYHFLVQTVDEYCSKVDVENIKYLIAYFSLWKYVTIMPFEMGLDVVDKRILRVRTMLRSVVDYLRNQK